MIAVIFEVFPHEGQRQDYLDMAGTRVTRLGSGARPLGPGASFTLANR